MLCTFYFCLFSEPHQHTPHCARSLGFPLRVLQQEGPHMKKSQFAEKRTVARHRLLLSSVGATKPPIRLLAIIARLGEPARLRIGKCVELRDIGLDVEEWGAVEDVQPANPQHVALASE